MREILSKSLEETKEAAKVFLQKLLPENNCATVVALSGDLGSGKTTFVQSIARLLGISARVTSPTFVIMKTYDLPTTRTNFTEQNLNGQATYNKLIHVDAYRLKKGEEIKKLGWDETISNPKNLIFIEWPENVADAIPKNVIKINFQFIDEKTRKISF